MLKSLLARSGVYAMVALAITACSAVGSVPRAGSPRPSTSLFDEPWAWVDDRGAAVTFDRYRGTPAVVTAIYTSCTVRCPFTVEKLKAMAAAFERRGQAARFFLVTLDPRTDTPERLHRFKETRHLPEDWSLLSGSDADTRALSRLLDVRPMFDDGHIDHDVRIGVFDAGGRLVHNFADWSFEADVSVGSR
jgi:protein SCO1/2